MFLEIIATGYLNNKSFEIQLVLLNEISIDSKENKNEGKVNGESP